MKHPVTHVVRSFLEPSAVWLGDIITAHQDYRPSVLCENAPSRDLLPADAVHPILPERTAFVPEYLGALRTRIRRIPPNPWKRRLAGWAPPGVTHAHFGPAGWRCADAGVSRLVTTFYGFDMSKLPRFLSWQHAYAQLFALGDAFLAEGPAMRDALIGIGAPADRTHVLPLIADLDLPWSPPDRAAAPLVVMAGRVIEKKGFIDGVRAFDAVAGRHPGARLLIIGSGPLDDQLDASIASSAAHPQIERRPFAERSEYRALLARATVFLQPSRTAADGDSEGGAPTTLFDAQALGAVVVASTHADIPFVVDREAAYLSAEHDLDALTDHLDTALGDSASWATRSEAGRRHVEHQHARSAVVDRLERYYDSVRSTA